MLLVVVVVGFRGRTNRGIGQEKLCLPGIRTSDFFAVSPRSLNDATSTLLSSILFWMAPRGIFSTRSCSLPLLLTRLAFFSSSTNGKSYNEKFCLAQTLITTLGLPSSSHIVCTSAQGGLEWMAVHLQSIWPLSVYIIIDGERDLINQLIIGHV